MMQKMIGNGQQAQEKTVLYNGNCQMFRNVFVSDSFRNGDGEWEREKKRNSLRFRKTTTKHFQNELSSGHEYSI